jgi:hypothetical protein
MRIHGEVVHGHRAGIFEKVWSEPVIFAGRSKVLDLLAEVPAQELLLLPGREVQ